MKYNEQQFTTQFQNKIKVIKFDQEWDLADEPGVASWGWLCRGEGVAYYQPGVVAEEPRVANDSRVSLILDRANPT